MAGAIHEPNPFLEHLGVELEEWREGYTRCRVVLKPHHINRSGVVHGGLLATLLDHVGGLSGLYCDVPGNRRYGMTLSLTTNFIAQSKSGRLVAIGECVRSGSKVFFSRSEVRTDEGVVLANGTSVHRFRGGSERPEGVARPPQV